MSEQTEKQLMKTAQAVVTGLIIGLLSGVGFAQLTFVGDVNKHTVEIGGLSTRLDDSRKDFESRLGNIIRLWESQLASERELIVLVREQNSIISRMEKLRGGTP